MSELVLDAVSVSRGAGAVISDVSLRVEGGEVLALVGPNGAGKTSLIESISGVTPHSAGSITLDGEPIDKLSRVARSRKVPLASNQAPAGSASSASPWAIHPSTESSSSAAGQASCLRSTIHPRKAATSTTPAAMKKTRPRRVGVVSMESPPVLECRSPT